MDAQLQLSKKKTLLEEPPGKPREMHVWVPLKLLIRKRPFTVDALVGAVTEVTDLLVAMETAAKSTTSQSELERKTDN